MTSAATVGEALATKSAPGELDVPLGRHIAALDGVRGAAILAVVVYHFGGLRDAPASWLEKGLLLVTRVGWCGVDLFFVLSGLLITGILLDTREAANRFTSFYMRRFLRIFPLYYAVLLGYFVVVPWISGRPATGAGEQVWYWTYLCNWSTSFQADTRTPLLSHFWSLAVEEQFYLVWPALVFFTRRQTLARLCVAVATVVLLTRVAMVGLHFPPIAIHRLTVCRIDALALGGLAAIVLRRPAWLRAVYPRLRVAAAVLCALLLAVAVASHGFLEDSTVVETAGLSLLGLLFAILVVQVVVESSGGGGRTARIFGNPALRWLGKYSYGIYVYNFLLYVAVVEPVSAFAAAQTGTLRTVVHLGFLVGGLAASAAVAVVSWYLLESPLLGLKRLFTADAPSRRGT